jgi:tRNA (guanine37-N1)-methyltransferase
LVSAAPSETVSKKSLRFDVISLFPEMFAALTESGITRRALEQGLWQFAAWNPRQWGEGAYRTVDDRPYGGGPGMVMMAAPLESAINAAKVAALEAGNDVPKVIYLSPQGAPLTQARVCELAAGQGAILLCGRYEGVDERLIARCVDEEVSLGDYVLSGGELAAMVLIDACVRLVPGALNDALSAVEDSFSDGILDCAHYTRPEMYENTRVPEVLLSGDHKKIRRWRMQQALARTAQRRPDLLAGRVLSKEEAGLLVEWQQSADNTSQ